MSGLITLLSGGGPQWICNLPAVEDDSLHHSNHSNQSYYNVMSLGIHVTGIRSVDVYQNYHITASSTCKRLTQMSKMEQLTAVNYTVT